MMHEKSRGGPSNPTTGLGVHGDIGRVCGYPAVKTTSNLAGRAMRTATPAAVYAQEDKAR